MATADRRERIGLKRHFKKMAEGRRHRLETWKREKLGAAFSAMVDRARELNLAVDINAGLLYSPELERNLNLQQFQSLLRHDLAEHFIGLPPKDRNQMISAMWSGLMKGSQAIEEMGTHPEIIVDLETVHAATNNLPPSNSQR
jgi:hypothetical protein